MGTRVPEGGLRGLLPGRRARAAGVGLTLSLALLLAGPAAAEGHYRPPAEEYRGMGYGYESSEAFDERYGGRYTEESAGAQTLRTERKVFDAVVLRPLQVVQVLLSAVFLLPAYPVGMLFDSEDEVMEICITEPVERAFRRPLGEL